MKRHIKRTILIVIAVGVITCLFLIFFPYHIGKSSQPQTMSLLIKDTDICGELTDKVLDSKWTNENQLAITVLATQPCETYRWTGDYSVTGNELTLYFQSTGHSEGCWCWYYLTYKISGLDVQDYNITIVDLSPL